jgi:hypothetical protein
LADATLNVPPGHLAAVGPVKRVTAWADCVMATKLLLDDYDVEQEAIMAIPNSIPVSAFQFVTSFKQVLHGTPVLFRVDGEAWRQGVVFSECHEAGVVSLDGETSGRFWDATHIVWPLLDMASVVEVGIEPEALPVDIGAAPEPDGAVYARAEEGEAFGGLYIATWQEVRGEREHFRMMSFKDPMGSVDPSVHWSRWGWPRLIWTGRQQRS